MRKHKKEVNKPTTAERWKEKEVIIMFKTRTFAEVEDYAKKVSAFVYKESDLICEKVKSSVYEKAIIYTTVKNAIESILYSICEIDDEGNYTYIDDEDEIEKIIYISADTAESIAKDLLSSDIDTIFSIHYAIEEFFCTE